ncbi:short-chain dehydrogenase [Mycena rosella]|uniref:Short-chain dehydrogenase n=1 Tax=Mycena rosella TaxID=1033263 RepID=A0AAD7GZU8_MYCRO|nr:short-chain dehydrogenase [Mycena rosella]
MLTFWDFIKGQFARPEPVLTTDLAGKTVVVLGANTGIGFEATKHFAAMNPGRLILACRSQNKGQAAVEKLKAATGYATAELWLIDLADFASVKQFAKKFEQDGGRLDILVENAAVGLSKYEATKDEWETSLQVNCLSTSLVALLLLPIMIKTATDHATVPRIVVVSSGVHYWFTLEKDLCEDPAMLKTLGSTEYCITAKNMESRYLLTKLLNVFFVHGLNARLAPATPLIVDAVSPGYCYSELRRHFSGVRAVVDFVMERLLAFTAERGSRQLVWAALAHQDHPEQLRGAYISASKIEEVADFVLSPQGAKTQDSIWDEMVEILGNVDPRINSIVDKYLSPSL